MRIVNRKEFFSLGDNVVFCYVDEHQNLSEPSIKDSDCGDIDFYVTSLNDIDNTGSEDRFSKLEAMYLDSSISHPLDVETSGRDGMFVDDQMFAVFETGDLLNMITRLSKCLPSEVIEALACMEVK